MTAVAMMEKNDISTVTLRTEGNPIAAPRHKEEDDSSIPSTAQENELWTRGENDGQRRSSTTGF
eukprot:gene37682-36187_t